MLGISTSEIVLRGGRVFDPSALSGGLGATGQALDVRIVAGRIVELGRGLAGGAGATIIDVTGLLVVPGFIDLHVHLREPGQEYKEDIGNWHAGRIEGWLHPGVLHAQYQAGQ